MTDRYEFVMDAAAKLRSGDTLAVDLTAVAEELEQVGRSDARELRHRVEEIIDHMLKLKLVKGETHRRNRRLWTQSVLRQRGEIQALLDESPSLRRKLTPELVQRAWRTVAPVVAAGYHVRPPAECPWTIEEIQK